jgi:hypothetical protein
MFPYDHLYELILDYQREKRATAERYRLAREAEQLASPGPPRPPKQLRIRLGLSLVALGNRLLEGVASYSLSGSQGSPCTD